MSKTITLADLSPAEKAKLAAEFAQEQKAEKEKQQRDRKAYKDMAKDTVPQLFDILEKQSKLLSETKKRVFEAARNLIEMKVEAFGVKEGQQSHTFSNEEGSQSITIGYRVVDAWDDTLPVGMEKVNQFLKSRSKDKESEEMVKGINILLKKDSNGNLKSSRVLELNQWAQEIGDQLLIDGVSIIMESYKPKKTCYFVDARQENTIGKMETLPLSISSVDFPEGTNIDFL